MTPGNVLSKMLCVGCGVCAGMCPHGCLQMADNELGEYRPNATLQHCTECGLCRRVCPFDLGPNETELAQQTFGEVEGIQHTDETGYYLDSWIGAVGSDAARWSRTSGGVATWILASLLKQKLVDKCVCVTGTPNPERLFEYAEFDTPESLWGAAKSSYYPVEISRQLRKISKSRSRYAIIGLPCVVKGIRLAQTRSPRLRSAIPFLLGLVCGQQRGKFLAEYLVRSVGAETSTVTRISFREERQHLPAHASYFAAWTHGGTSPMCVERHEGYGEAWQQGWFKQDACNYCDDVFAELADAVFMDAWLPEYDADPRGTSIVLVRRPEVQNILRAGAEAAELAVHPITVREVVNSQEGCLRLKRDGVAAALAAAPSVLEEHRPRMLPLRRSRVLAAFKKQAEFRRMAASRAAMRSQRECGFGLEVFAREVRDATRLDRGILKLLAVAALPKRAFNKIVRALGEITAHRVKLARR